MTFLRILFSSFAGQFFSVLTSTSVCSLSDKKQASHLASLLWSLGPSECQFTKGCVSQGKALGLRSVGRPQKGFVLY